MAQSSGLKPAAASSRFTSSPWLRLSCLTSRSFLPICDYTRWHGLTLLCDREQLHMFAKTHAQLVVLHKNSAHRLDIALYLACGVSSYTDRHEELCLPAFAAGKKAEKDTYGRLWVRKSC